MMVLLLQERDYNKGVCGSGIEMFVPRFSGSLTKPVGVSISPRDIMGGLRDGNIERKPVLTTDSMDGHRWDRNQT
jgi:hypothetical protein